MVHVRHYIIRLTFEPLSQDYITQEKIAGISKLVDDEAGSIL